MKKLILIVLMFSSVLGVKAQDTTRWRLDNNIIYKYVSWGSSFDSLGGIFAHGPIHDFFYIDSMGIVKKQYQIQIKQVFQHNDNNLYGINGAVPSTEFYYECFNYEGDSLFKMDTSGVLQWKVPFSAGFIAPGAGTDFYVIARDTVLQGHSYHFPNVSTDVIISKLDSSANVVWQDTIKSIGTNSWVEVYTVRSNKNGDLVVFGAFEDSILIQNVGVSLNNNGGYPNFIALLDSSGNLKWLHGLDNYYFFNNTYTVDDFGNVYYFLTGTFDSIVYNKVSLIKIFYNGSFSLLKTYETGWGDAMCIDTSGNLAVACFGTPLDTVQNFYPSGAYLTSIDTLGNILWEGVYGPGPKEWGFETPVEIQSDIYNNLIIHTIKSGSYRLVPDDSLYLPPISMNIMLSVQEMAVYPNPFSSVLNLSYELEAVADMELSLYDILGKKYDLPELSAQSGEQSAGTHELSVNTASLPSGTYFLRIRVGDAVLHRKLIKL